MIINLSLGANNTLQFVTDTGIIHDNVRVIPAFPISNSHDYISIFSEEGVELAWIPSLDAVSADIGSLILDELLKTSPLRAICSIENISSVLMPSTWTVTTCKGVETILIHHEEDIIPLKRGGFLLHDKKSNYFLLPHIRHLNKLSCKLIEPFIYQQAH